MQAYIQLVRDLSGGEAPAKKAAGSSPRGSYQFLNVEKKGKAFFIALNRPDKKNALNHEAYEEIIKALKESGDSHETTLTILTGKGDYYCSGNDLNNFSISDPKEIPKMAKDANALLRRFVAAFIDHPKPLIALVNGPAIGISVTTLGLCDVIYASDTATFNTPFSSLGQSPEGCSSLIFPMIMGLAPATEMLLFGKKLTATEAMHHGLVNAVFPAQSFRAETERRVLQFSELPPKSLVLSKGIIRKNFRQLLHSVNNDECNLLEERWQSEECMNAIVKFFSSKSKI